MALAKIYSLVALGAVLSVALMLIAGYGAHLGPAVILLLASVALFLSQKPGLKAFAFPVWVFASVAASFYYPSVFDTWFGYDLAILIVPLIQVIMFGMGTTLSLADFRRVVSEPWPVFIGMVLQFSVMPLVGLAIALLAGFDPQVAAGVVLIGSCPGGVASNLMAYLAGGNVALSVTMTSCSTLIAPLITPFLMQTLAGQFVPIDFVAMMIAIVNMIVVPVVAGIIANRLLYSPPRWAATNGALAGLALVTLVLAGLTMLFGDPLGKLQSGVAIGFILILIVTAARLLVEGVLGRSGNWMDRVLPIVSMVGIIIIISLITARSKDQLLTVGLAIVAAAVVHNAVGYVAGYWCSRLARLDERNCRTVAFEVGMQNGGMASGIAMNVLKSTSAAIAPALFGPWMNISGSVLAAWWKRKPTVSPERETPPQDRSSE